MRLHGNARTCPKSRRLLVKRIVAESWSLTEAAAAAGVSERTARKWVARFKREGEAGLLDRSSAPKRIPHRTPAERVESIRALRRLRMTAAEIAEARDSALDRVVRPADRTPRGVRPLRSPLISSWRQARSSDGRHRHRLCDSLA